MKTSLSTRSTQEVELLPPKDLFWPLKAYKKHFGDPKITKPVGTLFANSMIAKASWSRGKTGTTCPGMCRRGSGPASRSR